MYREPLETWKVMRSGKAPLRLAAEHQSPCKCKDKSPNQHRETALSHKALAALRNGMEISPANYKNARQKPAQYDFLH